MSVNRHRFAWLLLLLLGTAVTFAHAQSGSEHFTEIEYDEAGRVKSVETVVEEAAPVLAGMVPGIVRHGPPVAVVVTGSGLRGAAISAEHPGLSISAVTATATRATFRVQADASVPLGLHRLQFATVLGMAQIEFNVRPVLPLLQVVPNPLTLSPGESRPVLLRFDRADVIDHSLSLTSSSGAVMGVSPSAVVIPAGGTQALLSVQGVAMGVAALRIESHEIPDMAVPGFVTTPYQPPVGGASFYSSRLGVHLDAGPQPPILIARGPFASSLGVVMPGTAGSGPSSVTPLVSSLLGIGVGPVAHGIAPSRVVRGEAESTIEVFGSGLGAVAVANVYPADQVSVVLQSVDADGARAVLRVSAEAVAALGERELRLTTLAGAPIPFATRAAASLRVAAPLPELSGVSPLLWVRGSESAVLQVYGQRFAGASAVRVTPSDGVTVSATPTVNAEGTQLSVNFAVAADAPFGTRVISVVNDGGESSPVASAANSVEVIAALGPTVSPLLSPRVGVTNAGSVVGSQSLMLNANVLGVSVGPSYYLIQPAAGSTGSSLVLNIDGVGLGTVTAVAFDPAARISVAAPSIAGDGARVSAAITIDADAAGGWRRLRLLTATGEVAPTRPAAALFRVTQPLPEIESVSPLLLVPGAGPVGLTLLGQNFADATAVRLLPSEGITMSAPVAGDGGRRLSSNVSIAADAALGPRVAVVDAPTGSSTDSALVTNTVQLVSGIGAAVSPVVSPLLGLRLGTGDMAQTTTIGLTAFLLGVRVEATPPVSMQDHLLPSTPLGVTVGPAATVFTPRFLPTGHPAIVRVEGSGMSAVSTLAFEPADGISLDGALDIAPDGRLLTVPISVASDAVLSARRLVLRDAASLEVPFALAEHSIARVVGSEPRIDSISPIQILPNQTIALTIRGGSLFGTTAVTATPPTGLTFSANPGVNADGTQVTVSVTVAADAPGGPRVIRVVASGGTTTDESIPANTLTVVTGQ